MKEVVEKGLIFIPVPEFSDADIALGADESQFFSRHDLPEVPKRFEDMASELFFKGGRLPELNHEIDKDCALRAVRSWLSSSAPAHESKIATVGFALSVWVKQDDNHANAR